MGQDVFGRDQERPKTALVKWPSYRAITPGPFWAVSTRSVVLTRIWNCSDVIGTGMDEIRTGKDEIMTKLGRERTSLDGKGRL